MTRPRGIRFYLNLRGISYSIIMTGMDKNNESRNGETKELDIPLQEELDVNVFQKNLEQQAENLQTAGARRAQQQERQRQEAQQRLREEELRQQANNSVRYEKGYYDGYADALDEINERLAAEEEDEYDFGRHYSGKARMPMGTRKSPCGKSGRKSAADIRC